VGVIHLIISLSRRMMIDDQILIPSTDGDLDSARLLSPDDVRRANGATTVAGKPISPPFLSI
jgi:hypothetical protein